MIRNVLHIIFFSLTIPLLTPQTARTQDTAGLHDAWQQYHSHNPQEKLFVHPSKTFCLAGEMLWFKIYDVDASTHIPVNFSTIAYAELLDNEQRPLLQARIALKDGNGAGTFRLPVTLPSGNYQLRCYTSWMKNFNADLFFHQQITVVNTFKNAGAAETSPSRSIRFFPEGGNLVYGLRSRIAFQLTGDTPEPSQIKGYIIGRNKDTAARFQSGRMGTGSFFFTPQTGHDYKALIIAGDTSFTAQLPAPYDKGYVMEVTEADAGRIKVAVHTTIRSAIPLLYLLTHTGGQLIDIRSTAVAGNEAVFYIDKKILRDGISHLTVFDDRQAPVCERLYFKRPGRLMTIDAQLSQKTFGARQKADVTLLARTAGDGDTLKASLSLSVFLLDSLQDIPKEDITSYLLLSSELKGNIRNPRYYLEDSSAEASEALDNLLLTQGWSRFRWEDILQHKQRYFEFLPETNGALITGHLIDRRTGQPGPPTIGYLSVPGRSFIFSAAQSRPDGSIVFDTKNFYSNRDIIIQTNDQTADSNYRIDLTSPFWDKPTSFTMPALHIPPAQASQLLSRSIAMQAENSYLYKDKHRLVPIQEDDTIAFYGRGDNKYNLDDYTRFQTMEEVMREYIAEVRVRQQAGMFHYRVKDNLFNIFFEDDPLVLIDGVPSFDMNKMLATDPLKIQKIEIVARKFYTGPLVNDGIVSYRSYEGDLGGYQLDPNAIAIHYEGIQVQQEFYTPVYDKGTPPSPRIPDLRNLLQWLPNIETDPKGRNTISFYTSDIPGTYLLFVQGITDKGQPGSRMLTFTVHP